MTAQHPLWLFVLTVALFAGGQWLQARARGFVLFNPVLMAMAGVIAYCLAFEVSYAAYFDATFLLHGWLPFAVVAMAWPLAVELPHAGPRLHALALWLIAGVTGLVGLALVAGWALGYGPPLLLALSLKTVTAPIAFGIGDVLGGDRGLIILAIFSTGVPGSIFGPAVLRALRVHDPAAQGFILGVVAHAFGVARAVELGRAATAYASLGMGLTGLMMALLWPTLWGALF